MRLLYFILFISLPFYHFSLASLKITFAGNDSYLVKIDQYQYYVNNSFLSVKHLNIGNHKITFYSSNNTGNQFLHSTTIYTSNDTETIGTFANNVFTVSAVNQVNYGSSGSSGIINQNAFVEEVSEESFDDKKKDKIIQLLKFGMINSIQAIQVLETFSFDNHRLESAIYMIPYVIDVQNYWQAKETFSFVSNENAFLEALESSVNPVHNSTVNINYGSCLSNGSFNQLLQEVKEEAFDNNKTHKILEVLQWGKITTDQAIELLETYSFDSNRLEVAKEMINSILDYQNYWRAGETFDFMSNKDEFLKYIE